MTTVILFIAHEGVSQSDIWELWKQEAAANVEFRVLAQAPDKIKMGNDFVRRYRLQGDYYMKPTSWASFSVVYEILHALWAIYSELDGNFERIFLISGTDIPIVSLAQWQHDNPSKIDNYAGGNNDPDVHSTYMSLTSDLVQKIVLDYLQFPGGEIHRYRMLKLFLDSNIACFTLRGQDISVGPEETWLHCIPIPKNLEKNGSIVLPIFRAANPISPILWKSLDTPQVIGQDVSMTLREYIDLSRFKRATTPSLLTVRKVSEHAEIPEAFMQQCFLMYDRKTFPQPQSQIFDRLKSKKEQVLQEEMRIKFQREKQLSRRIHGPINKLYSKITQEEENSPMLDAVWQKLVVAKNFKQQALMDALEALRRNLIRHRKFLQSSASIQQVVRLAQKSSDYDDFLRHYQSRGCVYGFRCLPNKSKIAALKEYFSSRIV